MRQARGRVYRAPVWCHGTLFTSFGAVSETPAKTHIEIRGRNRLLRFKPDLHWRYSTWEDPHHEHGDMRQTA